MLKNTIIKIQVDREVFTSTLSTVSGSQILELANRKPHTDYHLYQKLKGNQVAKVEYEQQIDLTDPGIERFVSQKKSHADGEQNKFKIQLDREVKDAPAKCMSGQEILELFKKTPYTDFELFVKLNGKGAEKVPYDRQICFDDPGLERFTTLKLKHGDGSSMPKRDFRLPEQDEEFLDSLNLVWETIKDSNLNYVIIRGVTLPFGYAEEKADVAMRLDQTYPRTQIDMAYFSPKITRKDKRAINAVTDLVIEGKGYQQWSRHRTPDNPWREGVDCLEMHYFFVMSWLENEFQKVPNAA
jgi:hypothetical protein